jgi:GT2 family glycosyltransferase
MADTVGLSREKPDVSVVIPTFNRRASLARLLSSLDARDNASSITVEVLIVDNGSTDGTGEFLRQTVEGSKKFSLTTLREDHQGKANALNRGLASAKGKIILVFDDDVVIDFLCIAKHVEAHAHASFDAVQGKILPGRDPSGRIADLDRIREYNVPYIDYGAEIREIRGLTGTNMSFKREVFEKVGFFDTRLGPGAAGFSEDTEYSMRIRKAGFKIGYTPHAIVYHELNPNRYGRGYNRMVEYRKGLSRSLYRHDSIFFRVVPDLLANCLRYGLYRGLGKTQKAYKTEGRIFKCWGYLMGKFHGIKAADKHSEV